MVNRHNPLYAFQRKPSGKWPTKFVRPNQLPYSDIPGIGPWISKIGRIKQLWANPCSPDPNIWAYAFFQALPVLLISPIAPSATDFLIRRTNAGPGRFHGTRGKFTFDVWDILQPFTQSAAGEGWLRFPLLEWGTRLLWYFAVADATLDFAIYWESLAYQWAGCRSPQSPWGFAGTTGPGIWAPGLTGPAYGGFTNFASNIFSANMSGVSTPPGYRPTVTWTFNFNNDGLPPALQPGGYPVLVDRTTGEILSYPQQGPFVEPSANSENLFDGVFQSSAPHAYGIDWIGTGWLNVTSATIEAVSQNEHDMFFPTFYGNKKVPYGADKNA
jgi:hypothetical protein